jgi:DNA-binding MarR family transcriptional regulator
MSSTRIIDGVLHHVAHGVVSYGDLRDRLAVLPQALSRTLRLLANRGDVVLLDRYRQPLDLTRRACTRFVRRCS